MTNGDRALQADEAALKRSVEAEFQRLEERAELLRPGALKLFANQEAASAAIAQADPYFDALDAEQVFTIADRAS